MRALPAMAPALRACLAGDAAAFATDVREEDAVLVLRVQRGAGTGMAEECRARRDGTVLQRRPLGDAPPLDPAAPAFFLERRCVDARRVDAPDGRVLGWLAYPGC
jgi:hypothetical protein